MKLYGQLLGYLLHLFPSRVAIIVFGLALASCSGSIDKNQDSRPTLLRPDNSKANTWVFICDDQSAWTVRNDDNVAWVFGATRTRKLDVIPEKPGANYTDQQFELNIQADRALLGEVGTELKSCQNDPALAIWEKSKLDGATFRAIGNEPPWTLELFQYHTAIIVTQYGASREVLILPEKPINDQNQLTTTWDGIGLHLEISAKTCHDIMSGEQFESTVKLVWKAQILKGCGRPLH